jgi:hypothetical protein
MFFFLPTIRTPYISLYNETLKKIHWVLIQALELGFCFLPESHRKAPDCLKHRTRHSDFTESNSVCTSKLSLTFLRMFSVNTYWLQWPLRASELWPEKASGCICLLTIHWCQFRELRVVVHDVLRSPLSSFQWNVKLHVPEHFAFVYVHAFIYSVCEWIQQIIKGVYIVLVTDRESKMSPNAIAGN